MLRISRSDSIRLIIACLLDGLLLSERFGEEALGRGLSVVIVVAVADRLIVFGDGALALADGVPGVAAINERPDLDPIRSEVSVQRLVEGIQCLVPVSLCHIHQSQVVPGPGIASIEFDRGLELLLSLDVFLLAEMFYSAANDNALAQLFGAANHFR